MKKLIQQLQELKALFVNGIVSKEWYNKELDELIRYANSKEEIEIIHSYKDIDT